MKDENPIDNLDDLPLSSSPPVSETAALPDGKLSPELLAWALQQINEAEIIAGLEEIQRTGGLQLSDFIHELEQMVPAHD